MWCILSLRRKQIPGGLRDYLPEELARRRALERRITEVFNRWGYREVVTPTFEFVDVLESQTGYALKGSMYRFFDPDGELVALRPEMTTPIARLVSTRMRTELDPGRFWYLANVFSTLIRRLGTDGSSIKPASRSLVQVLYLQMQNQLLCALIVWTAVACEVLG